MTNTKELLEKAAARYPEYPEALFELTYKPEGFVRRQGMGGPVIEELGHWAAGFWLHDSKFAFGKAVAYGKTPDGALVAFLDQHGHDSSER